MALSFERENDTGNGWRNSPDSFGNATGSTMHLYDDQFSEHHDFPRVEKPSKILIIASTARSGGHMLGHALHKTSCFGFPLEYANSANIAEWKRRFGKKLFFDVLTEIQRRRTSPNGVFGIKIHYSHINQFGGFHRLMEYFPNAYYILLSREDLIGQAVSLAIASQTGVWISGQKPVHDNPKYNFNQINAYLRQTILENSSWRYSLAACGCKRIDMDFRDVRDSLTQSIKRIAEFVGAEIDPEKIPNEQVTKRQSNDINAKWANKFLSEFNGADELLKKRDRVINYKIKGVVNKLKGRVNRALHL
ncbi:MAG: Stf0 family sulfotransferase [Nitrospirota bacterium]